MYFQLYWDCKTFISVRLFSAVIMWSKVELSCQAKLDFCSRKKNTIKSRTNEEDGTKEGEAAGTCRICLGITEYSAEAILHAVYFRAVALLAEPGGLCWYLLDVSSLLVPSIALCAYKKYYLAHTELTVLDCCGLAVVLGTQADAACLKVPSKKRVLEKQGLYR